MAEGSGNKKALYEEIGKYFLDLSKLVFGGVLIAGIMNLDIDKAVLFIIGGISLLFSAILGFVFITRGKE